MMKRICALLCALACVFALCACGNQEPAATQPNTGEAVYKVKVVDGSGQPYTEKVVVKLMQDNKQIAMLAVNDQGMVEKTLPKGNYSVEIMSTDNSREFSYDTDSAKLTADKTELEIVLALKMGERHETVMGTNDEESQAFYVNPGTTHVTVTGGSRTYFLFAPTEAGNYEFYVADENAAIGVYGASVHYISADSIIEAVDGKITISVQPSMIGSGNTGTTVYVLGIDAPEGTQSAILNMIYTGDPEWSFTEEPWSNYSPKNEIADYTLPEGITLKEFDLTVSSDTYALVLNSEDGYYHLNTADGPLVFAQLGKAVYGICLTDMVGEIVYQDGVLMQTGTAPFRYSYNNGQEDFFKEDYTDAMREYVTARDEASGVYPLNEDLYYMLTMGVKPTGWCNSESMNYRFRDMEGINDEISWMFLLVYEDDGSVIPQIPTDPEDTTDPTDPDDTTAPTDPSETEHSHSYTKSVTAPSCTEKGYTTYTCACGHTYVSDEVSATGHSFGNWVTVKEPTATATGKAERTCGKCSAKEERTLDKVTGSHQHSYSAKVTKNATCTAAGVKTYSCSCGDSYTESISATGHSFGDWVTVKEPTTTATGKAERTCSKCSSKEERVLDKVAGSHQHSYTATENPKATCTTAGVITYSCSCGDSYTEAKAALGHFFEMNGMCIRCAKMDSDVAVDDNPEEHIEIGGKLEFKATIQPGHMMHYDVYRVGGTTLTIEHSDAFVIYNGVTYHAVNGVVTVPDLSTDGPSMPVSLVIGNHGTKVVEFTVKMTYPAGSMMNPFIITSMGKITTYTEEGNDQGVFYTYTATKTGKLTITVNGITGADEAGVSMCNQNTSACVTTMEAESMTISMEVTKGDIIEIVISAQPDMKNKYHASTIQTTISID